MERLVLPSESANILNPINFFTSLPAISFVSSSHIPIKTIKPFSILPLTFPSMVTLAFVTR